MPFRQPGNIVRILVSPNGKFLVTGVLDDGTRSKNPIYCFWENDSSKEYQFIATSGDWGEIISASSIMGGELVVEYWEESSYKSPEKKTTTFTFVENIGN